MVNIECYSKIIAKINQFPNRNSEPYKGLQRVTTVGRRGSALGVEQRAPPTARVGCGWGQTEGGKREREKETDGDRHRDREIDRERQKQTDRQTQTGR